MGIAIKAEKISKAYQLGNIGTGTLSNDLNRWVARIRGKEDPFLALGETNDRTTKGKSDVVWSLKDINFEIEQGDAVGIIGRNGAGKSTLLKLLSKVTSPTTGHIIGRGRVASLLEVGTGFHPELTGRENIYLNGAIMGMRKKEIARKFDEIVDFSGVERYIDTPVKRYSSGMYVRLAFAIAAYLESEILIVDEVLAVGDAEFQKKCLGKMGEVSKGEGRTVLFVSHNMGSITQLCNKGILLKHGEVKETGSVSNVINSYIAESNNVSTFYEPNEEISKSKTNYFTKIQICNSNMVMVSDFSFHERIHLKFEFKVNENSSGVQIGIGLQDKFFNKVFTIVRDIFKFEKENGKYKGSVSLPSSLIAPNIYSFVFAIWAKDTKNYYEILDNLFPIRIHDNGTELASQEGTDYGSVIIEPVWY